MRRKKIASLLHKYQSGLATETEREVVEQWYALLEENPYQLSEAEWASWEERLWQKLNRKVGGGDTGTATRIVPLWNRPFMKFGMAAAIVLLLGMGYELLWDKKPNTLTELASPEDIAGLEVAVNRTASNVLLQLEDGSRISLSPQAELRYPKRFGNSKRSVVLMGDAFFEIAEDRKRPFYVEAGKIVTKVIGTSFSIRAKPGSPNVEVAVRTGKVSVFEKEKGEATRSNKFGNGVILSPNHRVTFTARNKQFITSLVEEPTLPPLAYRTKEHAFQYEDIPLAKILSELEEAYGIEIELDQRAMGDCPLTANLSRKTLYPQLEIICAAIQGNYEVKGTTILISGRGCE